MSAKLTKLSESNHPQRWFEEGIKQHEAFQSFFIQAKERALCAGWFFLRARNALDRETSFELFCQPYNEQVSFRTVQRYIEFTEACLAWASAEKPALANQSEKLLEFSKKMVLQSPKPMVALCRSLRLMIPFGEYDAVAHARRKLNGPRQIEFDFAAVVTSVEVLDTFDVDYLLSTMPEGTDARLEMSAIEQKLRNARDRVAEWLGNPSNASEIDVDAATMPLALPAPAMEAAGKTPLRKGVRQ
jgi:hypothetical protein